MNGIEDLGALNLPLQMLRYVPVSQAGMPGAATLQIENAELTALKCRIFAEQLDDRFRVLPF